ncbi:hypothetical protein BZA05DRAFT_74454 [Tricharina praecox]|uniref:uncharacterized protein n=1 Tax=Tricharina praecox TaxID=43433 RepID=UPI0022201C85|nr:uncharacterized protein BZA05DRAFT_74454 [Tricharina praecox]KAI5849702.1 hypothetical protein BZA05DRAFT_74454 [Tricharina praecox]
MATPQRTGADGSSRRDDGAHIRAGGHGSSRRRAAPGSSVRSGGNGSSVHPNGAPQFYGRTEDRTSSDRYATASGAYGPADDFESSHRPSTSRASGRNGGDSSSTRYDGVSSHRHPTHNASGRNGDGSSLRYDGAHESSRQTEYRTSSDRYATASGAYGPADDFESSHRPSTSRASGRNGGDSSSTRYDGAHESRGRTGGYPSSGRNVFAADVYDRASDRGRSSRHARSGSSRRRDVSAPGRPALPPAAPLANPPQQVRGVHIPGWRERVYVPGFRPSDNKGKEAARKFDSQFGSTG